MSERPVIQAEFPVRQWPERRVVVLATATLLLAGVFAASMVSDTALTELAVLYALPVMMIGLELGVGGGAGAAAVAFALLFIASRDHPGVGAPGLVASGTVFLASGALAGRFSTRMRAGHARQGRLLASGLRLARLDDLDALPTVLAEEIGETLDFSSLEVQLIGSPTVEIGRPAGEILRVPVSTRGVDYGVVTLSAPAGRSFSEEERVVADKLALQAAVAADHQRLIASERERAAVRSELEDTRQRLASHLRNVSQILDSQEAERREIARHLHEGTAQAMGAVLLGLRVLERDLDKELTRTQLEEVRTIARDALADLRQLAVGVRPPSLDDLGLRAALEGVAERETAQRSQPVQLDCEGCSGTLGAEVETCAYYLVEDAIRVLQGSVNVHVTLDHNGDTLRIGLSGQAADREEALLGRLATVHARLELIGGTLQTTSNGSGTTRILAEIPVCASRECADP